MASIIITIVILQRILELILAGRNSKYMRHKGAFEIGTHQYKYFIFLHLCFFISLIFEVFWWRDGTNKVYWTPLGIFLLAQGFRIWCISSLGRYWNTRIFVLPGTKPITRGPYKYIRHPNYLVVVLEIAFLPLVFGGWFTAILFTIVNGILLYWRIRLEEWALKEIINYEEIMQEKPRLIPKIISEREY